MHRCGVVMYRQSKAPDRPADGVASPSGPATLSFGEEQMARLLAPLADIYPAGMPVDFLFYDSLMAGTPVEFLAGRGARIRRTRTRLDENGVARASAIFDRPGVYETTVVTQGRGLLGKCHVLVGRRQASWLGATFESCRYDESAGTVQLALNVQYNRHPFQGQLELDLRSRRRTIHTAVADVVDGRAEVMLRTRPEHPLLLVLHTLRTDQKTTLILPPPPTAETGSMSLSLPDRIERGSPLKVEISGAPKGTRGLLLISDARCASSLALHAARKGSTGFPKGSRKDMGLRLETGKLPGFIHRGAIHVPACTSVPLSSYACSHELPELFGVRQWQVRVLVPNGKHFEVISQQVPVDYPEGLYLDMPSHVARGDEIEGIVAYSSPHDCAELIVENGSTSQRSVPAGNVGETRVMVKGDPDSRLSAQMSYQGGKQIQATWSNTDGEPAIRGTENLFLRKGDRLVGGDAYALHPEVDPVLVSVAHDLMAYPHGCAEQTSSKLGGLAFILSLIRSGVRVPYGDQLDEYIEAGFERMRIFEKKPGMFCFWGDDAPQERVSRMVYRNLLPFSGLGVPQAEGLLKRARKTVGPSDERKGLPRFMSGPMDLQTAGRLHGDPKASSTDRARALQYVQQTAALKDDRLVWPEGTAWGGRDYSTCLALRVVRDAGLQEIQAIVDPGEPYSPHRMGRWDRLLARLTLKRPGGPLIGRPPERRAVHDPFWNGLNSLVEWMPSGRFHSTAATREYIGLLSDLRESWEPPTVRFLDGSQKDLVVGESLNTEGRALRVISGRAVVTRESERPRPRLGDGDIDVTATPPRRPVRIDDAFSMDVSYDPRGVPITTPVLRVQVPAHLQLISGGLPVASAGMMREVPLLGKRRLKLQFCGIRRGVGTLEFEVADMYDSDLCGHCRRAVRVT